MQGPLKFKEHERRCEPPREGISNDNPSSLHCEVQGRSQKLGTYKMRETIFLGDKLHQKVKSIKTDTFF